MQRTPFLPTEIVENIIQEAWSSEMAVLERTSLFTSLCLVNHTWLALFIRTSLIDVHIVSPAFAEKYLDLLHERSSAIGESDANYYLSKASHTANRLCRSITFHINSKPNRNTGSATEPATYMCVETNPMADSVSNVLYMLDSLSYTPNLCRVSLYYVDWGFTPVFDHLRLVPVPPQITDLEIRYSFSKEAEGFAHKIWKSYSRKLHRTWMMSNVRKFTVAGAPASLVSGFVEACPNLEVLQVGVNRLSDFGSLDLQRMPESLKEIFLHLSAEDEDSGSKEEDYPRLEYGMRRLLLGSNSTMKLQVVVCLHSPSQVRLESVRKQARRYGLEVISHST